MVPALALLPRYLAEQGYRDPRDEADTPLQRALGTELHAFEYIRRDPALARGFRSAVLSQEHLRRAHWADPEFYPVRERLLSGLRDEEGGVVVVDVGGGIGLDREDLSFFFLFFSSCFSLQHEADDSSIWKTGTDAAPPRLSCSDRVRRGPPGATRREARAPRHRASAELGVRPLQHREDAAQLLRAAARPGRPRLLLPPRGTSPGVQLPSSPESPIGRG